MSFLKILSDLGVGKKAKQNEANAIAQAQVEIQTAQVNAQAELGQVTDQSTSELGLIVVGFLILIVIIFLMLK
jgi:F0F1-type ATP synthase membrane subunit b/b'